MSHLQLVIPVRKLVRAIQVTPESVEEAALLTTGLLTRDMSKVPVKDTPDRVWWVDARARRFYGTEDTLLFFPNEPLEGFERQRPDGTFEFVPMTTADGYVAVRDGSWLVANGDWYTRVGKKAFERLYQVVTING